jgi:hypothetical protein
MKHLKGIARYTILGTSALGLTISRRPYGWYWKAIIGRQLLSISFAEDPICPSLVPSLEASARCPSLIASSHSHHLFIDPIMHRGSLFFYCIVNLFLR